MSTQKVTLKLSRSTAECIGAGASKEVRMFAASGKMPMEAKELVVALYYLAHDKDPDVKKTAQKSLSEFPEHSLIPILSSHDTHPNILDFFARLHAGDSVIQEVIVRNCMTEGKTIERIAVTAGEKLLTLIGDAPDRIRDNPEILEGMKKNSLFTAELAEKITTSVAGRHEDQESEHGETPDINPDDEITDEAIGDLIGETGETETEGKETDSVYRRILGMGVSQKIKFAITGNKEARSILVKDPNRLVCSNVMKNPRLTESEVVLYSASKNVSEEVFRMIDKNRDWLKNYQIKFNLVSNARVPLPIAMKYINHIRKKDLEILAKSRNVPRAISNMAGQLVVKKKEK